MARLRLFTFYDAIEHVVDYLGSTTDAQPRRYARRAVLAAYNEMTSLRKWTYFMRHGRINCSEPYSTGTVAFDLTGGAYERVLTLTTGTWPSWSAYGTVLIDSKPYDVAERKSSTQLTLTPTSSPAADVASTTYTIYRDAYPLPIDFRSIGEVIVRGQDRLLKEVQPNDWVQAQRSYLSQSCPAVFTLTGSPDYMGTMGIRFWPPPDDDYVVDYVYARSPRQLNNETYETGSVTAVTDSLTATGSGTTWDSRLNGAVIRFSANTKDLPGGISSENPYRIERVVASVASTTSLTLDAVPGITGLTGVKYRISDPVDLEEGAMLNLFLRECERQARLIRRLKPEPMEDQAYERARELAAESDNRSFQRTARATGGYFDPNNNQPFGDDDTIA
jgi:hypothetical protein